MLPSSTNVLAREVQLPLVLELAGNQDALDPEVGRLAILRLRQDAQGQQELGFNGVYKYLFGVNISISLPHAIDPYW